jgi:hypothetical protein
MWFNRLAKTITFLIIIGLIITNVQTSQIVRADSPLIFGAGMLTAGALAITGFGVTVAGAGTVWAIASNINGEDGGEGESDKAVTDTEVSTETSTSTDGLDQIVEEGTEVSESPALMKVPQDFRLFQPLPKGYEMQEEIHFNAKSDNTFDISYEKLSYFTDVLRNPTDVRREFKVNRVTQFRLLRPQGSEGQESQLSFLINFPSGLLLSTTDVEGTVGGVSLGLLVEIDGIGTVFSASAEVRQGQRSTVRGDLPRSVFDTSRLGALTINSHSEKVTFSIPNKLNEALISITFYTAGFGENCELESKTPLRQSDCQVAKNPSPAPSPGGTTIPEAVDSSDDGVIDDAELREAIQYWILGEPIPGANKVIVDVTILQLVQMWILGTTIEVPQNDDA